MPQSQNMVGSRRWFGKTLFPLKKEAAAQRRMPYAGDMVNKTKGKWTLRGRGHIWAAVGVPAQEGLEMISVKVRCH